MQSQLMYITDVLGVNEFINMPRAVDFIDPAVDLDFIHGDESSNLCFISFSELNDEKIVMLSKMAAALKQSDFSVIQASKQNFEGAISKLLLKSQKRLVLFSKLKDADDLEIEFGVPSQFDGGSRFIQTHSLENLTDSSHAYLNQMKKQTWEHLKSLYN